MSYARFGAGFNAEQFENILENEPIAHSSKFFSSSEDDTSLQTAIAWRWSNQSLTIWFEPQRS